MLPSCVSVVVDVTSAIVAIVTVRSGRLGSSVLVEETAEGKFEEGVLSRARRRVPLFSVL